MSHILLVEDEAAIAETLIYVLESDGHTVEWLLRGEPALERVRQGGVHMLVLDVGLPDMSGFDVCRELRRHSELPVLFLTARSGEIDRVVGLELGGDDYVSKPFSPREVAARVRRILKRSQPQLSPAASTAAGAREPWFALDIARGQASFCGVPLRLTRYELQLLACLLAHPGRIYTRAQLMDLVWTDAMESDERTVDTHIKTLRAKLRRINEQLDPIQTHRHMGYSIEDGRR